ncbi:uncharacterized protein LTR77_003361 [Saxophila tyrrhenica]|uniref:Uncharacterized protein n=1 Tax=Saxophila tyrrhenica TaxID=1690608 RepID=A0AAV9PDR1_9PEZI|nr:hypothetical protein LTR77_003361 [Saxophila tyrrhenica]
MTVPLDLLLRLPPALRSHAFTASLPRSSTTQQLSPLRRSFHQATRLLRSNARRTQTPPTRRPPPTTSRTTNTPSKPPPRPPVPIELLTHLRTRPSLLLYRAPSHTSLQITTTVLGLLFIYPTFEYCRLSASRAKDVEHRLPWTIRGLVLVCGMLFAAVAGRCLSMPRKMVRTIELVAREAEGAAQVRAHPELSVRFHMRHPVPFLRREGLVLETPLKGARMDGDVASHEEVQYLNVPLAQAVQSTEQWEAESGRDMKVKKGAWGTIRQDMGRIFWNEGFAHVTIPEKDGAGEGVWKLDLNGCAVLAHGMVLRDVMEVDVLKIGLVAGLKRWLRGKFGGVAAGR